MTKEKFIATYRDFIVKNYDWAADTTKLDQFMESVRTTLFTKRNNWAWNAKTTVVAWKAIGGKGKPTLKALRALP